MEISELVKVLELEHPEDGTLEELAARYRTVREAQAVLKVVADTIEDDLAARMEQDLLWTGAGWLSRSPVKNDHWRDEASSGRFRDDIARSVVQAVSVDLATGEMDPFKRNVARAAIDLLWQIVPAFSTVKQAGRRLGIDPGDYRESSTSYRVALSDEAI